MVTVVKIVFWNHALRLCLPHLVDSQAVTVKQVPLKTVLVPPRATLFVVIMVVKIGTVHLWLWERLLSHLLSTAWILISCTQRRTPWCCRLCRRHTLRACRAGFRCLSRWPSRCAWRKETPSPFTYGGMILLIHKHVVCSWPLRLKFTYPTSINWLGCFSLISVYVQMCRCP